MQKLLVIDDDTDIGFLLKRFLEKHDFEVHTALNLKSGLRVFEQTKPDLVLCDYRLPDGEGLDMIQKIKSKRPESAIIIMTGYSDVKLAIKCIKQGASDYVTKPIHPDEILMSVREALTKSKHKANLPVKTKSERQSNKTTLKREEFIVGDSPQSQQVSRLIDLIAPTAMSVIIAGETGSGKEYVAKRIHGKSERANAPFIAIDCGALPKDIAGSELFGHKKGAFTGALNNKTGAFELANGGTLFLDEIGNLDYQNQIKLLRVLQERKIRKIGAEREQKINIRIIAASNDDLWQKSQSGAFREDLYHRLNEFVIKLAPLREKPSEIEQFASHFVQTANNELGKSITSITPKTLKILRSHHWHGNLRELKNVIKRAVLLSQEKTIKPEHLPAELGLNPINNIHSDQKPTTLKEAAAFAERKLILQTLKQTGYNKSLTAKTLGVDRKTLYNKISEYAIDLNQD